MTSQELRQKYLEFFRSKGHAVIPSASLIPDNDPTVLFTTAGMHPLVPYLLGSAHPGGKRLVNVQKCIRTQDIEEVGDNRHDTFFEMLGNWSLGDYFKKEAIEYSWEFLTDKKWLGLDPKKLAVSVFEGDEDAPRDTESAEVWKSCGVLEHKIAYLPKKNNWWGPAGQTGPCGPDTEMFFWIGKGEYPPKDSDPKTDEDNWLEIWNDVFMQYNKQADGSFISLKQQNVDTGMGLERTLMVMNNLQDVFQIDTFWPLILTIEKISGKKYGADEVTTRAMRIIADHLRTATMILADDAGIVPSNVERGYVVRRLIRRAIRQARILEIQGSVCVPVAEEAVKIFADVYPEVARNRERIMTELEKEEEKFMETIEIGLREFHIFAGRQKDEEYPSLEESLKQKALLLENGIAFDLFQNYGFPLEITIEEAKSRGIPINVERLIHNFKVKFQKHQEISQKGAEQKFAGGLADHSIESTRYHTATHLTHEALRRVLGPHVFQKGSNITRERLRFDFSHPDKMTSEQIKQTEDLVNEAIKQDLPVHFEEMSFEEAKQAGAIGLFEDKYQEKIKVYFVGKPGEYFSKEVCGGPHVEHTGQIGHFKIIKEEAVSAGVRRLKAVVEPPFSD